MAESDPINEPITVRTKHAQLSLEDIATALPGTGEVMAAVGHAFGMVGHAAHGGNLDLAAYYTRRTRSLLRGLAVTRPKYADQIGEFDRDHLEPVYQALLSEDLWAFDAAYEKAIDQANVYHVETGYPYIRWARPAQPPDPGLDLGTA